MNRGEFKSPCVCSSILVFFLNRARKNFVDKIRGNFHWKILLGWCLILTFVAPLLGKFSKGNAWQLMRWPPGNLLGRSASATGTGGFSSYLFFLGGGVGLATTHLGSGRCCKDFVMFSWNVTHSQLQKISSWPCKMSTNIHPILLLQVFFSYHPGDSG